LGFGFSGTLMVNNLNGIRPKSNIHNATRHHSESQMKLVGAQPHMETCLEDRLPNEAYLAAELGEKIMPLYSYTNAGNVRS